MPEGQQAGTCCALGGYCAAAPLPPPLEPIRQVSFAAEQPRAIEDDSRKRALQWSNDGLASAGEEQLYGYAMRGPGGGIRRLAQPGSASHWAKVDDTRWKKVEGTAGSCEPGRALHQAGQQPGGASHQAIQQPGCASHQACVDLTTLKSREKSIPSISFSFSNSVNVLSLIHI